MEFNLAWGHSVAVRQAFLETYHGNMIVFSHDALMKFDYPTHEGDAELVEITRNVIRRQVGRSYKHVLLTNGATGGVVISLRAYFEQGKSWCLTRKAPFYVRYPDMIAASGLTQVDESGYLPDEINTVVLVDIPSNPLGIRTPIEWYPSMPTILDGVYYSPIYMPRLEHLPEHDVMVGSYSKLLGLNGIRIGWIATDDSLLYERLKVLVASEYCGLSIPSTEIIKNTLFEFNWDQFERSAKSRLDCNREEWSKLERFFGGTEVVPVGMFYYAPMDRKCKSLMEESNVIWTKGSDLGTHDGFGRFNLGQDPALIKRAVQEILIQDRI